MEKSILHVFFNTAARRGNADGLRWKVEGRWQSFSWTEYARRVRVVGRGLVKLGLPKGGAVAIIGYNRWEWLVADLATMAAGGVPAPIYTTCTSEQVAYVTGHCEATIAFAENVSQLRKFQERRHELPNLKWIVLFDGTAEGAADVITFDALMKMGEELPQSALDERLEALDPNTLATLIYTSGTTGPPKGVMLSHKNLIFTARSVIDALSNITDNEQFISYLPLSHIAEQMMSIHLPVTAGGTVSFAESLEKLADGLREIRPTVFVGVPRVWEKIQAKMVEAGASNPPLKKKIAAWARGVGLEAGKRAQHHQAPPMFYRLADKLVFSKVREKLGLDRCKLAVTSSAPIARTTLEFFLSLGVPLFELYGMSESTGPTTQSKPESWKLATVGTPLPGTQLKIAEGGEICMKGDHVFMGYLKNEEATRETLDADGWLHSGDVGEIDAQGFLRITDRMKDLIITAGGKNVAPQNLEALLKSVPGIAQAAVIGDRRPYLTALLTLDPDAAKRVAEQCGARGRTTAELAQETTFLAHLQKGVDGINSGLARYETIKKFVVLPAEFTVDSGELTPTMKLKRKIVNTRYSAQVEGMYPADGAEQRAGA